MRIIINPWCACSIRFTVVALCVSQSVRMSVPMFSAMIAGSALHLFDFKTGDVVNKVLCNLSPAYWTAPCPFPREASDVIMEGDY